MAFSTSSPSATTGGGQSNTPVCTYSFHTFTSYLCLFIIFCPVFGPLSHSLSSMYLPLSGAQVARFGCPTQSQSLPPQIFVDNDSHNLRYRKKLNTITMATMAANDRETTQPTCQNCTTSTTPLWRRDEIGSVLCNACGLFLKLHGRPRPISLKTDVIKSRNRVKSSGSAQGAKKKVRDSLLDADLQSVQTLTRRHRVYSIRMASTRRDHKGELHLPEPSAIDEPLKNPQMATLMARIPPSPALRLPRCMAICPLSPVTPSMTHITTPHRSRNFIFANHLQAALHLP
jgi:hypothetical protein